MHKVNFNCNLAVTNPILSLRTRPLDLKSEFFVVELGHSARHFLTFTIKRVYFDCVALCRVIMGRLGPEVRPDLMAATELRYIGLALMIKLMRCYLKRLTFVIYFVLFCSSRFS